MPSFSGPTAHFGIRGFSAVKARLPKSSSHSAAPAAPVPANKSAPSPAVVYEERAPQLPAISQLPTIMSEPTYSSPASSQVSVATSHLPAAAEAVAPPDPISAPQPVRPVFPDGFPSIDDHRALLRNDLASRIKDEKVRDSDGFPRGRLQFTAIPLGLQPEFVVVHDGASLFRLFYRA